MFSTITYLKDGSQRQKEVYQLLMDMGIMNVLAEYSPTLVGTIPIGIDIETSDLDIILEVKDFSTFTKYVQAVYGHLKGFQIEQTSSYITVRFTYMNWDFELYGENQQVKKQNAYIHLVIENLLLKKDSSMRERVIALKKEGLNTEAAFCKILNIEGDPFTGLINYMMKK